MYVAKIIKLGILFQATLLEKQWSQEMLSNNISVLSTKKFLLRSSAHRWIRSEMARHMFMKKKLEIIDE